jgi:uncharacterized protein (DUF2249 family)
MMGNFNINFLNYETHPVTDASIDTLGFYYFHPQILKPTRITDHAATLIDNIFFNSLEHLTLSGNVVSDISDHLPNFLINKISELPNNNLKLFKRNYSNFDKELFEVDVSNIDWHNVRPNDNNVKVPMS